MNDRDSLRLIPSYILRYAGKNSKQLFRELKKVGTKKKLSTKVNNLRNILNQQVVTYSNERVDAQDIQLDNKLDNNSYKFLLTFMGICKESTENQVIWRHAELVDLLLSNPFEKSQIKVLYDFLKEHFECEELDLAIEKVSQEEFYLDLLFSFIFHLDAYLHYQLYSKHFEPISLAWLFMQTPDFRKMKRDDKGLHITNKQGSPYTVPSRSLIQFCEVILYYQEHEKMPDKLFGLGNKVQPYWQANDKQKELVDFLKRRKEGDWIYLDELYWLLGFKSLDELGESDEQETKIKRKAKENLQNFSDNIVTYIKTNNFNDIEAALAPNAEFAVWFIYGFFQYIYSNNHSKKGITYFDYHDAWKAMTKYYESKISDEDKKKRTRWTQDIIDQATPF